MPSTRRPSPSPAGQGQHVPLGHQVAGEGDGQRQLREFLRLDRDQRAERNLDLGAVDLAARDAWQGRQRQQQDSDGAEGVGVALQHPRFADQDQHRDEAADADG
jgi:hypothetical protein